MPSKKRLLFALPAVVFPALVVPLLPACQRSAPAPSPQEARPATARQAVSGPACSPGSCAPLDEFDPLPGAGWMTLSTGCSGSDPCDITVPLQEAVNTIVKNTLTSWSTVVPTVLYIPPGNYTISSTIMVQGAYGGAIVGDDPSTTTITWAGPAPGTGARSGSPMFFFLDSTDTRFARITLDGGLASQPTSDGGSPPWLAGVQIAQSVDGSAPPLPDDGGAASYISVYNLDFDDDVFKNLTLGIASYTFAANVEDPTSAEFFQGGWVYDLSPGFAVTDSNVGSIDIRRSSFENIFAQAVAVTGQNTLDWLIEDNSFINCHRGVTVEYNASANLVNNLFFNNDGDDVLNIFSNGGMSNVYRGNVSVGANVSYFGMYGDNVDLSGNYVLLNHEPTTDGGAGNQHCYAVVAAGKTLLLDNYIDGPTNGVTCTLEQTGAGCTGAGTYRALGIYGTIAHGHNAYSGTAAGFIINPGQSGYDTDEMCVGGSAGCPGTGQTADSFGVAPGGSAVPAAAQAAYAGWGSPTIGMATASVQRPTIAPKVSRTVLTVPSACTTSPGTGCAAALNGILSGASSGGQYLLYFPRLYYYVDGQVEIPAGLDVVITGDGLGSELIWTGSALDKFVFHASAPAKAMFKDFQVIGNGSGSKPGAILVDSQDDTGGLVYVDLGAFSNVKSGIEVAGLDNVLVRAEQWGAGGERIADVIGGGSGSAGSASTQGLFMLAGGSTPGSDYVTTRNWGKAVILGSDNEGDPQGTVLSQSGYVTMECGRFIAGPPAAFPGLFAAQPNFVAESTFRGNLTFSNVQTTAGVYSAGARQAQVLAFGNSYSSLPGLPNAPVAQPCGTLAGPGCFPLTPNNQVPNAYAQQAGGGATQMSLQNWGSCTYEGATITQEYAALTNSSAARNTFADTMFADLRNAPYAAPICGSTCGQTRVRIHNVWGTGGDQNVYAFAMPPSTWMRTAIRVQRSN
jgi:hypothetical protein